MEFQQQQLRDPFEIITTDNTLSYYEDVVRKIQWRVFLKRRNIFLPLDIFLDKKPL